MRSQVELFFYSLFNSPMFLGVLHSVFSLGSNKFTNILLCLSLVLSPFSLLDCLFGSCSLFWMGFLLVFDLWVVVILTKSPQCRKTAKFVSPSLYLLHAPLRRAHTHKQNLNSPPVLFNSLVVSQSLFMFVALLATY